MGTGDGLVILISFAAWPLHGAYVGTFTEHRGVWPVRVLGGIGGRPGRAAVSALVTGLLIGTGWVRVGRGAAMTGQGVGAALSPAIDGSLAQTLGEPVAVSRTPRSAAAGMADSGEEVRA